MIEAVERLWRRLQMMVAVGRGTLIDDTKAASQLMQLRLDAATVQDFMPRMAEYGFQSVPPLGFDALAVFLSGNRSDGIVIATGHTTYRLNSLATGEVAISDDKGQKVYLSASGIRVEGGALPIEINTSGGLTVNADTTFNGTVTANGHRIDQTHRHTGVSTGSGTTGTVT